MQAEANQGGCWRALATVVALAETTAQARTEVFRLTSGRVLVTFNYPPSEAFWVKESALYVCLPDTVDPRGAKGK